MRNVWYDDHQQPDLNLGKLCILHEVHKHHGQGELCPLQGKQGGEDKRNRTSPCFHVTHFGILGHFFLLNLHHSVSKLRCRKSENITHSFKFLYLYSYVLCDVLSL